MALLQVVVALLTAHTCFGAETVKLIINECFDDLVLGMSFSVTYPIARSWIHNTFLR